MTTAQRIRSLRLIEKMEKSIVCEKDENRRLKYIDKNGNNLIEARVKRV